MEQKEIYFALAEAALKSVNKVDLWTKSILYIKRLEGNVGFESYYTIKDDLEIPIDTEADYQTSLAVHELHKFMSITFGDNSKWNRLKFTLFFDNKIETEFIWDEELQNEIDKLNRTKR
jgi:hypothetical protein